MSTADHFPTDTTGLPEATPPEVVELADGAEFDLRITPVVKRLGDATVRMLGYNGSIPGPTLKVEQGSEIVVNVTNHGDLDTTVHWHGLRLENKYDGVPHETQAPIPVGGSLAYRLQFPDPGLYWYHPHIREDYTQEMGLYGTVPVASWCWPVTGLPSPTWCGRTPCWCVPGRRWTSCSTSPIPVCGWRTATSPSTTRAG